MISRLLAATASLALAAPAQSAIIDFSFRLTASGFHASAPVDPVVGDFYFSFDDSADFGPTASGLTIANLNIAGAAQLSYNKPLDRLTVATTGSPGSFSVSTGIDNFGFFVQNASSATRSVSNVSYSQQGGSRIWGAQNMSITAVPEPGSWALMISGFGLAGAALRSRRRVLASA